MPDRPTALVFDVFDTLFPLGPLEWRFREAGVPRVLMTRWCDHVLRDVFALSLLGEDRGFQEVARGALRDITGDQIAPAAEDGVIDGLTRLQARREAADALEIARRAGVPTAALGHLQAQDTRRLLDGSGLEVDVVVDGGGPGSWKPLPASYLAATQALGTPAGRSGLVTAHGWDVAGGRAAGLVTGWSSHLEGRFSVLFDPPHAQGRDLVETVQALLTLPG